LTPRRSSPLTDKKTRKTLPAIVSPEQGETIGDLAPIQLRGVRVHNLKNIDVDIPRGKLVAICGVSGSGKTSLALDTLYAEGQRRYIESFSAYTRQFLERLDKPDYDSINQLPPALAVTRSGNPRGNRSTVGTASETLDYLRVFFAKIAQLNCTNCGRLVEAYDPQAVAKVVADMPSVKAMLCYETHWEDALDRATVLADLQAFGFVRIIAGQRMLNLGTISREELANLLPVSGNILVVVDRVKGGDSSQRLTESLENAFQHGDGKAILLVEPHSQPGPFQEQLAALGNEQVTVDSENWLRIKFTRQLHCAACDIDYPTAEPRLFSFNSPLGACPTCEGFGDTIDMDMRLIVPDVNKSIREGAIAPWNSPSYSPYLDELVNASKRLSIPLDKPFRLLTAQQVNLIVEGDSRSGFEGLKGFFAYLERKKYKMHVRVFLSRWRSYNRCTTCNGKRLNAQSLAYSIGGHNFAQLCDMEIDQLAELLSRTTLNERQQQISNNVLEQTLNRLNCLQQVGLGYLTLGRTLRTLSGGEAQRTALTMALGSTLVNMLYVLDEPSVGLHPHDVQQLAGAVARLADRGNTVVVIEHEEILLDRAEHLIEVGPQAGESGGEIVFAGTRDAMLQSPQSLTGNYLKGTKRISIPGSRRRLDQGFIELQGCTGNNLKNIDVKFPLGVLSVVTGVSGSGKSSLVQDTLYAAITNHLKGQQNAVLPFCELRGVDQIDDCILVDQSPVSRSPRSNPITYVKAFDEIRHAFAETVDAKTRNYSSGHFSFNSELGRCETCQGDGSLQIDMQFLADVTMTCPTCHGNRYRSEVLSVRFRDRTITDVLRMTVREAIAFFRGSTKVQQKLKVLVDVGLEYLQLGQAATTLSSGEAQRLKLAAFLASASRRRTLFILDEPTTGLHTHDIKKLITCFEALLEFGHSLLVVEHNLHLIATADHVIDLGPGPSALGGQVVACGSPEEISKTKNSLTGQFLKLHLHRNN
jgi:excinuclease ABC subunit A